MIETIAPQPEEQAGHPAAAGFALSCPVDTLPDVVQHTLHGGAFLRTILAAFEHFGGPEVRENDCIFFFFDAFQTDPEMHLVMQGNATVPVAEDLRCMSHLRSHGQQIDSFLKVGRRATGHGPKHSETIGRGNATATRRGDHPLAALYLSENIRDGGTDAGCRSRRNHRAV